MADALDIVAAHAHAGPHRAEILNSEICGCFHCLRTFAPSDIREWVDERQGVGQTAVCLHCGIDSVIGSASGYPITNEFLAQMRHHWFEV